MPTPLAAPEPAEVGPGGVRPPWRRIRPPHALAAVLLLQTACSLRLIWSNTAFGDEADYLWMGHQVIAHWLHGTSWPSAYGQSTLSGSPLIYPPIGAAADALGGLAGARALSMCFMLAATWFLYSTAARLFGRRTAVFAAALFALSEPALRLAFATYDPMSVMLTALSAWLIARMPHGRRRGEFVALGAIALALANATAYSGVAADPVVAVFAVLAWRSELGSRAALRYAGWLAFAWAWCFTVCMFVSGSFGGMINTVLARTTADQQSPLLIIGDVWTYSGFVLVLALAGAVLAFGRAAGTRRALLFMLGLTGFVVPLAQLHEQTGWSLDKHLAYGLWFASMAAGYALSAAFAAAAARHERYVAAAAAAVVLAYPGYAGWQSAWLSFHSWQSSASYVAAIRPLAARTPGRIYTDDTYLAQYYTPQGRDWDRWNTIAGLPPLSARGLSAAVWGKDLRASDYGLVVLFYSTPFAAPSLSASLVIRDAATVAGQSLLQLAAAHAGQPGLPAATQALQADPAYTLVATGPYSSRSSSGIYAIWRKEQR